MAKKAMKKILIISVVCLLLIIFFGILVLGNKKNNTFFNPFNIPTPTPVQNTTGFSNKPLGISIVSLSPKDKTQNVSINSPVTIQMSQPIDQKNVFISFTPDTPFTASFSGNIITVTPISQWDKGTTYLFFISFSSFPPTPSFSFTTEGVINNQPVVGDNGYDHAQQQLKIVNPDVFLSNYTPYNSDTFSVESAISSSINGHFYFLVTLHADSQASLRSFYQWLSSLNLSQSQIQSLDIRFTSTITGGQQMTTPPPAIDNPY